MTEALPQVIHLSGPLHVPLAHVTRGPLVESVHHGSVVVLDADGRLEFVAGDPDAPFYPRSALKPLQAVGMLRAGLDLHGGLLALSAASHSAEKRHLDGVLSILGGAGLSLADLRNPADFPVDPVERAHWIAGRRKPAPVAHNCSGKHAAMLRTARNRDWPTSGYLAAGHPVQSRIEAAITDLTGTRPAHVTVDGCGAPLFAVSLVALTRAMARIATARPGTHEARLAEAMRAYPDMLAGTRRDVADLVRAVPGLIVKDGFEAVQVAALPDGRAVGVKIADGSDRARMPVTAAALAIAGVDTATLAPFLSAPVLGGGMVVGGVRLAGAMVNRAATVGLLL
ncbi:asparaginase [Actinomadura sp. 6N118]|uniref:asparaginase n=1 Tax=Actinomadura sp. 6N118 TaxID=3375151 RepID=UPI00378D49F0